MTAFAYPEKAEASYGINRNFFCNVHRLEDDLLLDIHANVRRYVASRGDVALRLGEAKERLVSRVWPISILPNNHSSYIPGAKEVLELSRDFTRGDLLLQNEADIKALSQRLASMNGDCSPHDKLAAHVKLAWIKRTRFTAKDLIYNLAIQDTERDSYNQFLQPQLRNALAIQEYFRIISQENGVRRANLDDQVRSVLDAVPEQLRRKNVRGDAEFLLESTAILF